jgi:PAS domain S-box-containing protein
MLVQKSITNSLLRILFFKDSQQDEEIYRGLISDAGYNVVMDLAASESEFESYLLNSSYDVILSDFNLPKIDAFAALRLCQNICPDVPFICVSALIGKETAIELIKSGAVDFVYKDKLDRLPIAIQRAVNDAKEKKIVRDNEKRFRTIFEQSPIGMAIMDLRGNLIISNLPLSQMIGYSEDELLKMKFTDFTHPDDIEKDVSQFKELITGRISQYKMEKRYIRKNGDVVWVNIIANLLNDEKGVPREILGMAKDITERKRSEKLLRETEELFRHSFEYAANGICIVGLDTKFQRVNKAFTEMTGYNEEELKKFNFSDITYPEDIDIGRDVIDKMMNGEVEKASFEKRYIRKDKKIIWAYVSTSLVRNVDNKPQYYVSQVIDISDKKRAEQELIQSKEKAELSNRLKDAFIANISHEIRTPLNGIMGMSSLIKDIFQDRISKEDEELFEGVELSSKRIIRTVDLILNYSRFQVGEFPLYPKKFNLSLMCMNLTEEYLPVAKFKSLELNFRDNCGDAEIFADEYSTKMAISNLIDNAIKFTKQGSVEIIIHKNGNNEILLDVKDTGIGISDEFLLNLFEPYRQEHMGYGRAYEGVGLGLSLVKKIMSLNNAILTVESKKGEGTTFTINFGQDRKPAI